MQLGIHVTRHHSPAGAAGLGPSLAEGARAADEAGVTHLSLMDHFFQMDAMFPVEESMFEGYTGLGFLAAHTSRVRLGLLVTGVTYRHPGVLAKTIATLDVLSGGRAQLGIGAAWYEREHVGLGVPFPPLAERFERLDETIRICRQMWEGGDGPFEGTHYRLAETLCEPRPLSSPVPVLIGGAGEQKTLRLVARHAQACNLVPDSPEFVTRKLDVLRRHCDDVGRDASEIATTILHVPDPADTGRDAFLTAMRGYAEVGVDLVVVSNMSGTPVGEWVTEHVAHLVEPLADL